MKDIYTQQHISEFFEEFKSIKNSFKIEKVHRLINHPNAKATHREKFSSKPLKIIIMTSALIIGIFAIFLNYPKEKSKPVEITTDQIEQTKTNETRELSTPTLSNTENNLLLAQKELKASENIEKAESSNQNQLSPLNDEKTIVNKEFKEWPSDTVLNGKSLFVRLTNEELLKLGIKKTDSTVYYRNAFNGHATSGINYIENVKLIKDTTHYNFYKVYDCDIDFSNHGLYNNINYKSLDTLVPIIIKYKTLFEPESSDKIWWFTANRELFEVLPERYKNMEQIYTELKKLKNENKEHTYVNYFNLNQRIKQFQQLNFLSLTDDELTKIGFEFVFDSIMLKDLRKEELNHTPGSPITFSGFDDGLYVQRKLIGLYGKDKKEMTIISGRHLRIKDEAYSFSQNRTSKYSWEQATNPIPKFITDTLGRIHKTYYISDSSSLDFNTLLPVKIDFEKYNFEDKRRGKYEYILWYEPNEEFTSRLSSTIGNEIKSEYEALLIDSEQTPSSCTYFEVCKSTLNLEEFKLYPNPAKSSATIEFTSNENMEGSISIVNMAGAVLRELLPSSTILAGQNTYELDLSGVTPGIYLIYINTDKGFKTQRVIVSE